MLLLACTSDHGSGPPHRRDPTQIPWASVGADYVVESTGVFTDIAKVGSS